MVLVRLDARIPTTRTEVDLAPAAATARTEETYDEEDAENLTLGAASRTPATRTEVDRAAAAATLRTEEEGDEEEEEEEDLATAAPRLCVHVGASELGVANKHLGFARK